MIRIDKSDLLLEVDERIFLPHFVAKFYTVDRHLSSVKREKPDKEEEENINVLFNTLNDAMKELAEE